MKKLITLCFLLLGVAAQAQNFVVPTSDSITVRRNVVRGNAANWGLYMNSNNLWLTGLTKSYQIRIDSNISNFTRITVSSTATLPTSTSIGSVSSTELASLDGVSSSIQTQINTKAPISNPTFTGTVAGVTKSMVGLGNVDNTSDQNKPLSDASVSALALKVDKVTGKELSTNDYTTTEKNKLAGISTGATANSTDSQLRDRTTHTGVQGISTISNLQDSLSKKSNTISPTFTGTVSLPSLTTIGLVSSTELGYIDGLTSNAQTQFNNKVDKELGKGLSTNDFTNDEKAKLLGLENGQIYKGNWNAETNDLGLTTTPSAAGDYYIVSVAGTQSITGSSTSFAVGDRVISNGTAWVKSVFVNYIPENTVSPEKTTFIKQVVGKNLFNLATTLDGFYQDNYGNVLSGATYAVSDFISVLPSTTYRGQGNTQAMRFVTYYDENKTLVTGGASSFTVTFTTPENVRFVKITILLSDKSSFQLERGTVRTAYESYTETTTILGVKNQIRSIGSTQISRNAVSVSHTNFVKTGKNLFNKNNAGNKANYYILYGTGEEISVSGNTASYFIPILPSTQYITSNNAQLAFYDSDSVFISGLNSGRSPVYFTTPEKAQFIRCTISTSAFNTFQLELGSTSTSYEDYYLQILPPTGDTFLANGLTTTGVTQVQSNLSITTGIIQNQAVTPPKTNFLKLGKNKFDSSTTLDGFYQDNYGGIYANSAYSISDFIPINAGVTYTSNLNMRFTTYYNESKVLVAGGSSASTLTTFTVPAGVAFVKITVHTATKSSFQLETGSVSTGWEKWGYIFDGDKIIATIDIATLQNIFATDRSRAATTAIAPKLYTLNNTELAVYYENVHKYADDYKGRSELTIAGGKITGRSTKFVPTSTGTTSATFITANERFETIKSDATSIVSVNPTNTTAVSILNIGDSYTYGSKFVNKLISISSNMTFLGIRGTAVAGVNAEGRGGYALNTYTTLSKNTTFFSPFMQPSSVHKFYGVTGFWKIVHSTGGYDWDSYDSVKSLFNASTGYLISPSVNDVMYDNTLAAFYTWDGSAWVTISESTLAFTFNFAKYRTVWGIALPKIVHSLFGTNDWAGANETTVETGWSTWKTNMDLVIASIKADNSATKIIIGIPNSSGKQGDDDVLWTARRKRAFWVHAKKIIENYAGRESEGIYVADYHSIIDRQFAFNTADELPFANYTGTYRNTYKSDAVHLSDDGYIQMGNMYAALIQFLR